MIAYKEEKGKSAVFQSFDKVLQTLCIKELLDLTMPLPTQIKAGSKFSP